MPAPLFRPLLVALASPVGPVVVDVVVDVDVLSLSLFLHLAQTHSVLRRLN